MNTEKKEIAVEWMRDDASHWREWNKRRIQKLLCSVGIQFRISEQHHNKRVNCQKCSQQPLKSCDMRVALTQIKLSHAQSKRIIHSVEWFINSNSRTPPKSFCILSKWHELASRVLRDAYINESQCPSIYSLTDWSDENQCQNTRKNKIQG